MKIAVLSDIHSNLEALLACLDHARRQGAEQYVFLGDLLGYGADPLACLEVIAPMVGAGAPAVRGNHEEAVLGGLCENLELVARDAIYWTRKQLRQPERDFIQGLPMVANKDNAFYVHASAASPERWTYIDNAVAAAKCMDASGTPLTFVGHVHHQSLYYTSGHGAAQIFNPVIGAAIPVSPHRRWLAIAGSVGQPRDGNTAAAYLLHDQQRESLTFFRVPYDYLSAARKIRAAGLPERLARRLETGN
ncbi:MAG: metallophosphoesterase [Betaproteobacteria bacterium RBG_16_56_24]|nr:MAG: metallophosphoesterase [Betaproteobacteria bacterium RBG_16_56_24]